MSDNTAVFPYQLPPAWEQRKLGEVASGFEYGLNAAASDFDGEKKYLRITDIDDQTREFRTDDLSSPDINNPIDDRYLLKEGDILFARTGASVGKTYLYKASDGKTYYAGFLIRAHVSDEADAGFIFQSTLTERYKQFVLLTSQRSGSPASTRKNIQISFCLCHPDGATPNRRVLRPSGLAHHPSSA